MTIWNGVIADTNGLEIQNRWPVYNSAVIYNSAVGGSHFSRTPLVISEMTYFGSEINNIVNDQAVYLARIILECDDATSGEIRHAKDIVAAGGLDHLVVSS